MTIVRILCFIAIFSASTAIGFYYAEAGQRKIKGLMELKKAIIMLKSEIEFKKAGLKDAFKEISLKSDEPISSFFKGLSEYLEQSKKPIYIIFQQSITKLKVLNLTNDEVNRFISFSKAFGLPDKKMQIENLNFFIDYIEEQIKMYTDKQKRVSKLYRGLGMIFGVLIIIILI